MFSQSDVGFDYNNYCQLCTPPRTSTHDLLRLLAWLQRNHSDAIYGQSQKIVRQYTVRFHFATHYSVLDILMGLSINLTKCVRRRKKTSGKVVEQTRYVLNWRDPRTGSREQQFFAHQKDAQYKRTELIAAYERALTAPSARTLPLCMLWRRG